MKPLYNTVIHAAHVVNTMITMMKAGLYPHEKQPSEYFVPTPSTVTV
ncbi:hypothetical protein [Scardovia inopinata]|nr:hypothetical protein [Scardovia inopinata]BAR06149.1 hypothetical protein SCIP_0082 [Scardovia inopinata JCM 12537]